jgi:porin
MGTRLRADVSDNLTLIGGLFDGDAAGPGQDDPQLRDRYGVNFRVNDPPLVLAEAQFLWNGKKGDPGLDGKFKLGGWRHFGTFTDERFTLSGVSLANPASGGVPANLSGDFGVYSVFEQKIYRVGQDDDRGVGVFGGHPIARRTAISSMSIQMRASSSWVSAKVDRKINSVSPEAMRASRRGLRRSTPISST